MYRLLIADDEPKIRNGLSTLLPWSEMGFEEIFFAANGREAIAQTNQHHPDLCLLDICMPLLNGLDFVAGIRRDAPEMVCIVVSGYDEFEYAKRALQLGVFDYILKPVQEDVLKMTVEKAIEQITNQRQAKQQQNKAKKMLARHLPAMRDQFFSDLITGVLAEQEISDSLSALEIEETGCYGLILTNLPDIDQKDAIIRINGVDWPRQLLIMAIQNVMIELLSLCGPTFSFCDSYKNIIAVVVVNDITKWNEICPEISRKLKELLKIQVDLNENILDSLSQVPTVYADWIDTFTFDLSPVVRAVQAYLEKEFADPELSILGVAEHFRISVSHLSNLFRTETGMTLIDYLTRVRIHKAARLLEDTGYLIVEIAQKVGYSRQHYFCAVFRRVMGQSPTEYRQRKYTEAR